MLTVNKLIPQARGIAPVLARRAARVELAWDVRQRSRFDATDSSGRTLGVFLPRGSSVRGGDVLVAEDGSLVVVDAAAEPVMVVTPCPHHGSAFDLMRATYHLGNRHVALEIHPDRLQLEPDPVLADLLRQMDFIVTETTAAFEPEGGAYAASPAGAHAGHGHRHEHGDEHPHGDEPGHGPGHTHAHANEQEHSGAQAQGEEHRHGATVAVARLAPQASPEPHVHGPDCGHAHR